MVAKPGLDRRRGSGRRDRQESAARQLTARAHDLRAAGMSDEEVAAAQEMVERKLGLRCGGCGRRIRMGFEFTQIAPRQPQPVVKMAACSYDDCGFAEELREGATVVRMLDLVWLDEGAGGSGESAGCLPDSASADVGSEPASPLRQTAASVRSAGDRSGS